MDIKELYTVDSHEAGSELRLTSPLDGAITDCYLTIVGIDSAVWREAEIKGKRQVLELFKTGDSDEKAHGSIVAETLSSAVIAWRGFENEGKSLKFDRAFLKDLIVNSPSIGDQIDHFIADRVNFIKG
jgi:hypothetical protein|tara:strand:- start:533 stop:916 length:384 start_codon:yes stop_codon:yes gene_type:complete